MKKCIIFGNCQVTPIKTYLRLSPTFDETFKIVDTKPVHDSNGIDEESLLSVDLFIYQKVRRSFGENLSTDYLLNRLSSTCQTISIPNAFFKGYHPQHGSNPTVKPDPYYSNKPSGKFPYGDINIIRMLEEGRTKDEIIQQISDVDYYEKNEVLNNLNDTLNELKRREEGLDITISDFIADSYKNNYLFYSVNHPHGSLLKELSMRILNKLGIDADEIKNAKRDPFAKAHHVPIYPSVIKHLGLTFVNDNSKYSFYLNKGGDEVSFKEYVSKYIDHATS